MAQRIERPASNRKVVGSNPTADIYIIASWAHNPKVGRSKRPAPEGSVKRSLFLARVTQSVECWSYEPKVEGSSPSTSNVMPPWLRWQSVWLLTIRSLVRIQAGAAIFLSLAERKIMNGRLNFRFKFHFNFCV